MKLEKNLALMCFIFNCLLPGVGSVISSFAGKNGFNIYACLFGVGQMLTCWLIVGWIWSIYHGFKLYELAKAEDSSYFKI